MDYRERQSVHENVPRGESLVGHGSMDGGIKGEGRKEPTKVEERVIWKLNIS